MLAKDLLLMHQEPLFYKPAIGLDQQELIKVLYLFRYGTGLNLNQVSQDQVQHLFDRGEVPFSRVSFIDIVPGIMKTSSRKRPFSGKF